MGLHLWGRRISASGPEAAQGRRGSGSCVMHKRYSSGEETYLSSASTAAPRTFLSQAADDQEATGPRGYAGREHPPVLIEGAIGFGTMDLHQRLNWIRKRARWRPSVRRRQFKRKWVQNSGTHQEPSAPWGSGVGPKTLKHNGLEQRSRGRGTVWSSCSLIGLGRRCCEPETV